MCQGLGRISAASMRNRKAGAMQSADACHFLLRVVNQIGVDRLLGLEDCINTLRRYDCLPLVAKYERGILSIEDQNVDLLAKCPSAVDDVCPGSTVSLGKIGLKQFQPDLSAGVSFD